MIARVNYCKMFIVFIIIGVSAIGAITSASVITELDTFITPVYSSNNGMNFTVTSGRILEFHFLLISKFRISMNQK